jgi:glycosyltransferase involved in cell wall biosynthesis
MFRRWRTEVVHTHNERPLLYAAPAGRLARVRRVIHTKHGRGTGNTRRQNWLAAGAARLTDRFACVSEDCTRLALQQGVPANRLLTLHNGIDTRRFAYTGPQRDGPAVAVARLCADKDLATLLHAVAQVIHETPEFRLHIAGDGPCLPELRHLTSQLDLTAHVRFLGPISDVPALLQQARLSVLSSVSEGVPLTLLEAMACGLPVVATHVGGVPEVVQDGVNGLLVNPAAPADLASALLRVHRDFDFASRLGSAGRRSVESRFDVRQMIAQYERLYAAGGPRNQRKHEAFARIEARKGSPCESRI